MIDVPMAFRIVEATDPFSVELLARSGLTAAGLL